MNKNKEFFMTHAEITIEEEKLIGIALAYLQRSKSNGDEILATYRLTNHWEQLIAKYEGETHRHFWSKRSIYLVGVIVRRYVETKLTKK
jgi:hypothetical protein